MSATASAAAENSRVSVRAIVVKDGKVLLGERIGGEDDGHWEFPGGKLEFGEPLKSAAYREVLEETGIMAGEFCVVGAIDRRVDGGHWVIILVTCRHIYGTPKVSEPTKCKQWGWFDMRSLPVPVTPEIHRFMAEFGPQVAKATKLPIL